MASFADGFGDLYRYMVLNSLYKQGKLVLETVRVDGAAEGIDAPCLMISLK